MSNVINILIVDDQPDNLRLLVDVLSSQGYNVRPARNGQMALRSAQSDPPDLILLDVMMPGMDGYEVCRLLKADAQTKDIPVIFLSALGSPFDKVKALEVGGLDYITKPFHWQEVIARVNTHLALTRAHNELRRSNAELDAFAHMVAHDLKNPLANIIGYVDLLLDAPAPITPEQQREFLTMVRNMGHTAINIVEELLMLARVRKEDVQLEPVDMTSILTRVQYRLSGSIIQYQAELTMPDDWPIVYGYGQWIEEVWINYISNGLKYGGQPPILRLGYTPQEDEMVRFWVKDNGDGLDEAAQESLFTEFSRLGNGTVEGHGLGLSIVQRIVEKLGGMVGVESKMGDGSLFYFTLQKS